MNCLVHFVVTPSSRQATQVRAVKAAPNTRAIVHTPGFIGLQSRVKILASGFGPIDLS